MRSSSFLDFPSSTCLICTIRANATGRVSGLLTPVVSDGSSIRGYTFGEPVYWAINRSMDMVIGSEDYPGERGWAPNGDYRCKGPGLDHLIARWNALLDRGIEEEVGNTAPASSAKPYATIPGPTGYELVNPGGVDVTVLGRKDLTPDTRVVGAMEYLSNYVYRLVFDDNYSQAISFQVASDVVLTHNHNGILSSVWLDRFESFASTTNGDEMKILRLPLSATTCWTGPLEFAALLGPRIIAGLSEPLRALFPPPQRGTAGLLSASLMPFTGGGWSFFPEAALRDTAYTISQTPQLTGPYVVPTISHEALNRKDVEASVDIRPPALERDYELPFWRRERAT